MFSTVPIAAGLGLVAAMVLGSAAVAPPPVDANRIACKQQCTATEPEGTDRTTCELVCDTRANNRKSGPTITRWKTEKDMGGPPPGVAVGSAENTARTTTTVTNRSGTAKQTTGALREATTAPPAKVRGRPTFVHRVALASCQTQCDFTKGDGLRWACKLGCLHDHPTDGSASRVPVGVSLGADSSRPPSRRTKTTAPPSSTATPSPSDACGSECARHTGDDRSTCLVQCRNQATQTRTEYSGTRAIGSGNANAGVSACRTTCASERSACRNACTGADASTCRLQCDQAASACQRRCS